jgi:hypothetical protein
MFVDGSRVVTSKVTPRALIDRFTAVGFVCVLSTVSCRTPPAARQMKESHPSSRFEVRLTGCTTPTQQQARSFGSDARTALLWSRERVRGARYFPCIAVIRAIGPRYDTTAVYHLSMGRDGSYEERAVLP